MMRNVFFYIIILLIFSNCEKQNELPQVKPTVDSCLSTDTIALNNVFGIISKIDNKYMIITDEAGILNPCGGINDSMQTDGLEVIVTGARNRLPDQSEISFMFTFKERKINKSVSTYSKTDITIDIFQTDSSLSIPEKYGYKICDKRMSDGVTIIQYGLPSKTGEIYYLTKTRALQTALLVVYNIRTKLTDTALLGSTEWFKYWNIGLYEKISADYMKDTLCDETFGIVANSTEGYVIITDKEGIIQLDEITDSHLEQDGNMVYIIGKKGASYFPSPIYQVKVTSFKIFGLIFPVEYSNALYAVDIIHSEDYGYPAGYGYYIHSKDTSILGGILQPHLPAVSGFHPYKTEKDAMKNAMKVVYGIKIHNATTTIDFLEFIKLWPE